MWFAIGLVLGLLIASCLATHLATFLWISQPWRRF